MSLSSELNGEVPREKMVIFDTDPGLDDAIALFFLLGRRDILDPLAITTVYGNVDIEKTTHNALRLLRFLNIDDVPVYQGASSPLIRDRVSGEMIHGRSGLGDIVLPEPVREISEEDEPAALAMARKIRAYPGKVTVITVGPMTNLALALSIYPDIVNKISEVLVMGGSMGQGNRTASAEYNIFADPHAAQIVFSSGVSLVMLGLDVTEQTEPGERERDFLQNINHPAAQITLEFMNFFRRQMKKTEDMAMHDACAVAYAINPQVFDTQKMRVDVELTGTYTFGRTVCSFDSEEEEEDENKTTGGLVNVAVDIDREQFYRELFSGFVGLEKF